MLNSLKQKIILPIILIFMIFMGVTIAVLSIHTTNLTGAFKQESIIGMSQAAAARIESLKSHSHLVVYSTAVNEGFIRLFQEGNREEMLEYLNMRKQTFEISGFIITDESGSVVLRTYAPDIYGDSDAEFSCIASALRGETTTAFASNSFSPMAITSAAPVYDMEGRQIGVVSAYINMATNDFAESFAEIFNAEVIVFAGHIPVASTIDPHILDDFPHTSYYFPLIGHSGEAVGTFFIGFPDEFSAIASLRNGLLLFGSICLLLSVAVMLFALSKSTRKAIDMLNQTDKELKQREVLLDTVNRAAEILLTAGSDSTFEALSAGMGMVGRCVDADRVQLWRNEIIDNELHFVLKHEWLSVVGEKKTEIPFGLEVSYDIKPKWLEMFLRGEHMNGPISLFSQEDMESLREYEIVSAMIYPLFLDNELFGFIGVDDCRRERVFTQDEINMFSVTGLMFASVFNKQELAQLLLEEKIEERTNLIMETVPMAITLFNEKIEAVDCNYEAAKMFGIDSKEKYLENYFSSMISVQPDGIKSQECIKSHIEEALNVGYSYLSEFTNKNTNGSFVITENTYIRKRFKNEFAVIEYTRDITGKKEAERYVKELTRKLVDNAPIFIEMWNEDGSRCIGCNKHLLNVFGLSNENEFVDNWQNFSAPTQPCGTSAIELNTHYITRAHTEGYSQGEWSYVLPNGEELPTDTTWIKIEHYEKDIIIAYGIDLRPIKSAMKSEESNRAKTRFLARMSHEIRTPISAVLGISEIQLRGQDLPPKIEGAFSKIYDSAKTLLNIVNDILDFSKIESGKMPIVINEYDVASLVSDAAQLHLVYADDKNVLFKMNIDQNLPVKLIGDVLRIRQIITNLLTNAFKYTESGEVVLSVHCDKENESSVTLVISIEDTGIGMTSEQIAELRSDYVRFHEQQKPFVSGTGLGIPIIYSLTQMMDAQFDLKSEAGKGTLAVVRIPQMACGTEVLGEKLATSLQNFEPNTWSAAKDLAFVPTPVPQGSVLVVDDIETNLYVAEAMLESFGLDIELCISGEEAVEKIKQGEVYDIIFLDHMMPGMDGIEVTKILREMGYDKPIVALTANAIQGQAEMFMENGFSGFMAKPIDIKILNSYLVRFIGEE